MRRCRNVFKNRTRQIWQHGACAFHAGYLRLQIEQVVSYLLFFHCNNVCTNAPQCHVIRKLPVLSLFIFVRIKAGEHLRKAAMLFFYSLQIYQAYRKKRCTFSKIYCTPLVQVPKIVTSLIIRPPKKLTHLTYCFFMIVGISSVVLWWSPVA
jgi:hypothetical protein